MSRPQGFTLLEVIIVLAVLGLAAGLLVEHGPQRSPAVTMAATAQAIAQAARLARAQAVAGNRDVRLLVDGAAHAVRVGNDAPIGLAPGIAMSLMSTEQGAIRFFGDGSATRAAIMLDDGTRRSVVSVDWLTGRIAVAGRS